MKVSKKNQRNMKIEQAKYFKGRYFKRFSEIQKTRNPEKLKI